MSFERQPDVWDGDAEPVRDDGDRDNDSSPKLHRLELARSDELVGGGAADSKEVAGLGDGQDEGSIGSHALLGLFEGQNLTRTVEKVPPVRRRHGA